MANDSEILERSLSIKGVRTFTFERYHRRKDGLNLKLSHRKQLTVSFLALSERFLALILAFLNILRQLREQNGRVDRRTTGR